MAFPWAGAGVGQPMLPVCPQTGAGGEGSDARGFCTRCGVERASMVEDHVEVCVSVDLGGVSDRGTCKRRNEDFLALGSTSSAEVLVVCDGMSNSQHADQAARVAATCACESLLRSLGVDGKTDIGGGARSAMFQAIRAADAAVRALPVIGACPVEPGKCTIVAAGCFGSSVVIGWLGDSRAYWLDYAGIRQLTEDHSWVNEAVGTGELKLEEALRHPMAHAVTRALGSLAGNARPSILELDIGRDLNWPARLILCTDGLWDCATDPHQFLPLVTEWIGQSPAGTDALSLAQTLVENACRKSGHDNITVATLTVGEQVTERRSLGT